MQTITQARSVSSMSNRLDLNGMSIDDLLELQDLIREAVKRRAQSERDALRQRLARLEAAAAEGTPGGPRPSPLKGRKVAPKYRNPDNPSQTWAGRGQMPAWMAVAVANGASVSDFEIPGSYRLQQSRRNDNQARKSARRVHRGSASSRQKSR